ncbi:hypothetical protein LNAOJCKE_1709 [Methylorubrum aminovorans]|uniref:Putative restriction endonuclease domain-containing protein n=1 Tax=Methylorubrum aminovorans TaxID=269069 RepID=A0ABQ4UBV9_9HYPH|nr:hypothetical protein LNAOJCKE_1709 [Methylorubrum aminovorans]
MSVPPKAGPSARMNFDEFLVWAEGRPGRYELVDGEVFAISPEGVRHAETELATYQALGAAIHATGLPCRVLPDGVTVRIDASASFEPDALVYCGGGASTRMQPQSLSRSSSSKFCRLAPSTSIPAPSSSTILRLPSLRHDLILDTERRTVIHHRRGDGELIETRLISSGDLFLDPPGLTLPVAALFAAP